MFLIMIGGSTGWITATDQPGMQTNPFAISALPDRVQLLINQLGQDSFVAQSSTDRASFEERRKQLEALAQLQGPGCKRLIGAIRRIDPSPDRSQYQALGLAVKHGIPLQDFRRGIAELTLISRYMGLNLTLLDIIKVAGAMLKQCKELHDFTTELMRHLPCLSISPGKRLEYRFNRVSHYESIIELLEPLVSLSLSEAFLYRCYNTYKETMVDPKLGYWQPTSETESTGISFQVRGRNLHLSSGQKEIILTIYSDETYPYCLGLTHPLLTPKPRIGGDFRLSCPIPKPLDQQSAELEKKLFG